MSNKKENEPVIVIDDARVEELVNTLTAGGIAPNPVRVQLRKGATFHLVGAKPSKIGDGDPFPMFTTVEGYEVSPKYFIGLEGDTVKLENSIKGLALYVLTHAQQGTEFTVTKYKRSEGKFGEADYKPTECELEIA